MALAHCMGGLFSHRRFPAYLSTSRHTIIGGNWQESTKGVGCCCYTQLGVGFLSLCYCRVGVLLAALSNLVLVCGFGALSTAMRMAQTVVGGREGGHADNERACVVAKTSKKTTVTWTPDPAEHDYPAAESFLRLIGAPALVKKCTALLSEAPTVHQHAKDILRAAALPLLAVDDPEVARDLKAVAKGTALSPILLIGGDISTGRVLQIADGYHRVCASYHLNEDTEIPCRLVTLSEIAV